MKRFIHLHLSIVALIFAILCFGCGTEPVGTPGKVTLDKSAYSGVANPMTITLDEPDLTHGEDVDVNVSSSIFPLGITVRLESILTEKGSQYVGTVAFSTVKSGKDTLRVQDGVEITVTYKDGFPQGDRVATAVWKGTGATLSLDAASYKGVAKPMAITLVDSNAASSSLDVKIYTSRKKSLPLTLSLAAVTGVAGRYSGSLFFSTDSTHDDTIFVRDNDTVFVTHDAGGALGSLNSKAVWNGTAGAIALDTSLYTGASKKMTITLVDPDILGGEANVFVKSDKDTAGIAVALKANGKTAGTFTGEVGFSFTKSGDGVIAVSDSNTVRVIYKDIAPVKAVSATALWRSGIITALGISGSGVTPGAQVKNGFSTTFYTWGGTCTIDSAPGFSGSASVMKIVAGAGTWAGFGWGQANAGVLSSIDMSSFQACSLHVMMKGNATGINLLVENLTSSGQTWVAAGDYGYAGDEAWHAVTIPLSAWSATCDLSGISYFLGAVFSPMESGKYIVLDNIYWTLPATAANP